MRLSLQTCSGSPEKYAINRRGPNTGSTSARLLIDARWLRTGIGTYTSNLLHGLARVDRSFQLEAIAQRPDLEEVAKDCDAWRELNVPIYSIREQVAIPFLARGASLLHVPHYNVPLLYRGPMVVTIHDLTHLLDATARSSWRSQLYARPML